MRKILLIAGILLSAAAQAQNTTAKIEAEKFNETNTAMFKKSKTNTFVNKFDKGAWIKFNNVNFADGISNIKFNVASGSNTGKAEIEFRLGSEKGTLLGKATIKTNGWNEFSEQSISIVKTAGKQDLVIVSTQGGVLLDWFTLEK